MTQARGGSVLIGALIVDSLGNGLFLPLSLVFFLKLTTVSLAVLGLLASAATVVTLPVPVWTGTLADRFDALPLVVAAQLLQAVGYLSFTWVRTPAGIFFASALVAIGVRVF
ncbi:MAG: MFS transporter, partial [Trebonia sp.]